MVGEWPGMGPRYIGAGCTDGGAAIGAGDEMGDGAPLEKAEDSPKDSSEGALDCGGKGFLPKRSSGS